MTEPARQERVQHGPGDRVFLCLVGTLFCAAGVGFEALMLVIAVRAPVLTSPRILGILLGVVLFAALTVYGVALVTRGVRGHSTVGPLTRRSRSFEGFLRRWGLIFGASEGLLFWLLTRGHAPDRMGELALLLWYASVGYLLFPFASGPHELGHALAARAAGVSIEAIRVWPLVLLRDPQRRFRLSVSLDAPGDVGGSVHFTAAGAPPTRRMLIRIVGAGPLANGVCALLLALAAHALGEGPRTAHGIGALLWAAAAMNLAVMLSNLIPRQAFNGMPTDGAQLLGLWQSR